MPSSSLHAGLRALSLVTLTTAGCALLYDFEDGASGGKGGEATGAGASGISSTRASSVQDATADASASTGNLEPPPTPATGVLVGGEAQELAAQRGVVVSPGYGPTLGVLAGDDLVIAGSLYAFDASFGAALASFGPDLSPRWGDLLAESAKLGDLHRNVREAMVASADDGRVLIGGTLDGELYPNQIPLMTVPGYRTAYAVRYDPDIGFVATGDVVHAISAAQGNAQMTLDGLVSDLAGGAYLGISGTGAVTVDDADIQLSEGGAAVFHLDSMFAVVNAQAVSKPGESMVDLQAHPGGFTVSLRSAAGGGRVRFDDPSLTNPSVTTAGEVTLGPIIGAYQTFCENDPANEDRVILGMYEIANTMVARIELANWSDERIVCTDMTTIGNDVLVVGRYQGSGAFAALPGSAGMDGFLVRVRLDATVLWSVGIGGPGDDRAQGVAYDPSFAAIYVAGRTENGFLFGQSQLTPTGADAFLLRFDTTP